MRSKRNLVLDTWVIAKASARVSEKDSLDEIDEVTRAIHLLYRIYDKCHTVVLDLENKIFNEWKGYLFSRDVTILWYTAMRARGTKFDYREGREIKLSTFPDPENIKFVELAATLSPKLIITGDSEFINWGKGEEARKYSIEIWDIGEALGKL